MRITAIGLAPSVTPTQAAAGSNTDLGITDTRGKRTKLIVRSK